MINIQSIYQKYNIKFNTNTKDWIHTRCPFCEDKKQHFGWNIELQYFKCFRCGWHSNYNTFLKLKIPLSELNNHSNIQTKIIEKLNNKIPFALPGTELNETAKNYLLNRGFDPDYIINKYKLLWCNHLDIKYKFRIVIPIIYNNQIISYTTRDYTDKQSLRYISCPKEMEIIEHKTILYNFDNCNKSYIIVVEGIFDCWRFDDNCCATFGISYTKEQVNLLTKYDTIYICFDNEIDAQNQAVKLGELLSGIGKKVFIVTLPEKYKDVAEMNQDKANLFKEELLNG